MRKAFVWGLLTALVATGVFLAGCHSLPRLTPHKTEAASRTQWYQDPSVEFGNYRTYGFLQVTAVRYVDEREPLEPKERAEWKKHHAHDREIAVHHTDELIWRVLQDEMQRKGYAQVPATEADLWVVYYGGPRPVSAMSQLRIKPNPFDRYFAKNELKPQTFFVDVIDAKQGTLIYRGWDNQTFTRRDPDPDRVISAATASVNFFPSRR